MGVVDQTLLQISLITDKQTAREKGECANICKCIGNCIVAVVVVAAIIITVPTHNRSLAGLLFHTGLILILYCNVAS